MRNNYENFAGRARKKKGKEKPEEAEKSAEDNDNEGEAQQPQQQDESKATAPSSKSDEEKEVHKGTGTEPPDPKAPPEDEKWRLRDGGMAQELLGRTVTKEFKRKGAKISRGIFHGAVDKVTWEEHLKDPIVFWCLFKEDNKYVRYNQAELKTMLDEIPLTGEDEPQEHEEQGWDREYANSEGRDDEAVKAVSEPKPERCALRLTT
jgi:hypothetical protein